jgi:hypothetical protein
MLVGRNEGGQGLMLQSHFSLTATDKISVISQHPKPDVNQGFYMAEYNHKFDRLDTTVKVSNNENSFTAAGTVYKNIFLGFEATLNVNIYNI